MKCGSSDDFSGPICYVADHVCGCQAKNDSPATDRLPQLIRWQSAHAICSIRSLLNASKKVKGTEVVIFPVGA